ncbi:MAG TPA: BON domain-containing protein [Ktedonobacterales bacterium]
MRVGPAGGAAVAVASQRGKGPAQRTDEQIKTTNETVLTDDPWLGASGVQVGVQQGVVTLTGMVPSRAAKRRAEALADWVGGVRDVPKRPCHRWAPGNPVTGKRRLVPRAAKDDGGLHRTDGLRPGRGGYGA